MRWLQNGGAQLTNQVLNSYGCGSDKHGAKVKLSFLLCFAVPDTNRVGRD